MKSGLTISVVTVLFFFSQFNSLYANDNYELTGDRPDYTESALVVPAGGIQIETGYSFSSNDESYEHTIGEMLLRIGLFSRFELRLGINSLVIQDMYNDISYGKDPLELGFKLQILAAPDHFVLWHPDIAFIGFSILPIGSGDFTEQTFQPGGKLILAWPLAPFIELSMNFNYTYASENESHYHEFAGSVSLGFDLSETVGLYIEYYIIYPDQKNGVDANYLNGGFTLAVTGNLQLDIRGGIRLKKVIDEYFAGAGIIFYFTP